MAKKYIFQITLVMNLGFKTEEHKLLSFTATEDEYADKQLAYRDYEDWPWFEGDFVDDYNNVYFMTIGKQLLIGSYFKFKCLGLEKGETEEF